MAHKPPKRGRRTNATGRSIGDGHHARLYRWMHRTPAFQNLSIGARALLIELKMLYNGTNNGDLFMSIREAGKRLNIGKSHAAKLFRELHGHGFIRPNVLGAYNLKSAARRGEATSWILTEHPIGDAPGSGSKDFMAWAPSESTPAKIIRRSTIRTECPPPRTLRLKVIESVHPRGHFAPDPGIRRSTTGPTDNLPREVA